MYEVRYSGDENGNLRYKNITYKNITGRPIVIYITLGATTISNLAMLYIDGVFSGYLRNDNSGFTANTFVGLIPNESTYKVVEITGTVELTAWSELR